MERKTNLYIIVPMLCMLIISPQLFAGILPTKIEPTIVSKKTMMNIIPMEIFDTSLVSNESIEISQWSNGSTTIRISECFKLNDPYCPKIWIKMNQTIPPKDVIIQEANKIANLVQPCGGTFPGKYSWDGLIFLPKDNNGTHNVEYTCDDNLDTYYPCEWFTHWNLPGTSLQHIHLGAQEITDWLNGVKDKADILSVIYAGTGGGLSILGGIAALFHCTWAAVPAIIGGAVAIFAAIIQFIYGILEAQWIRDVVQTWYGDGFAWMGAILQSISMDDWWDVYENRPLTMYSYFEHRLWQQSWGAERDNSQSYEVTWWSYVVHNGGGIAASIR